ncbi:hypothetical protein L1987_27861 [Smallanthus sonchifolius]|uniref:Uncharacterized protein n=1 Tax=Smallanthus sonchifolius TaxID=185202 RepID=A0ACB9ID48_9ASTR|nr:hypothetical protein L1987_27861 [Smallanthus sonchifolius]
MRGPMMCNIVCRITLDEKTTKEFKEKIGDEYRANMILDDLPLVVPVTRTYSSTKYQLGYFVGSKVQYADFHKIVETSAARIVGFEVKSLSINHKYDDQWSGETHLNTCNPHSKHVVTSSNPPQEVDDKKEIIFTYDVEFQESDVKWASRWDTYLLMTHDQTPIIVNSLMNVLLYREESWEAVPFGTMFFWVFLWFGISVPLCGIQPARFHVYFNSCPSILLRIRFGVRYFDHDMCGDDSVLMFLQAAWRRLPMVLAIISNFKFFSLLFLHIRDIIFLHITQHHRACSEYFLFQETLLSSEDCLGLQGKSILDLN